ncbi:MAG: hypothetical protein ACR2PG_15600 [Hyphomicrobiaceae bacterium]
MVNWIQATAANNRRSARSNADTIAHVAREQMDGHAHIHFLGLDHAPGKPDLLVLEEPEVLVWGIERLH